MAASGPGRAGGRRVSEVGLVPELASARALRSCGGLCYRVSRQGHGRSRGALGICRLRPNARVTGLAASCAACDAVRGGGNDTRTSGGRIWSSSADGSWREWSTRTGAQLRVVRGHGGEAVSALVLLDQRVYGVEDGEVGSMPAASAAGSERPLLLATGGRDGHVAVWDVSEPGDGTDAVTEVARWAPTVAGPKGRVVALVFDHPREGLPGRLFVASLHPDQSVHTHTSCLITAFELGTWRRLGCTPRHPYSDVRRLVVDRPMLHAVLGSGQRRCWDMESGVEVAATSIRLGHHEHVSSLLVDPFQEPHPDTGARAHIYSSGRRLAFRYDRLSATTLYFRGSEELDVESVNVGRRAVFVACNDDRRGIVRVYDKGAPVGETNASRAEEGGGVAATELTRIYAHNSTISSMTIHDHDDNDSVLVTGSTHGTVRAWRLGKNTLAGQSRVELRRLPFLEWLLPWFWVLSDTLQMASLAFSRGIAWPGNAFSGAKDVVAVLYTWEEYLQIRPASLFVLMELTSTVVVGLVFLIVALDGTMCMRKLPSLRYAANLTVRIVIGVLFLTVFKGLLTPFLCVSKCPPVGPGPGPDPGPPGPPPDPHHLSKLFGNATSVSAEPCPGGFEHPLLKTPCMTGPLLASGLWSMLLLIVFTPLAVRLRGLDGDVAGLDVWSRKQQEQDENSIAIEHWNRNSRNSRDDVARLARRAQKHTSYAIFRWFWDWSGDVRSTAPFHPLQTRAAPNFWRTYAGIRVGTMSLVIVLAPVATVEWKEFQVWILIVGTCAVVLMAIKWPPFSFLPATRFNLMLLCWVFWVDVCALIAMHHVGGPGLVPVIFYLGSFLILSPALLSFVVVIITCSSRRCCDQAPQERARRASTRGIRMSQDPATTTASSATQPLLQAASESG